MSHRARWAAVLIIVAGCLGRDMAAQATEWTHYTTSDPITSDTAITVWAKSRPVELGGAISWICFRGQLFVALSPPTGARSIVADSLVVVRYRIDQAEAPPAQVWHRQILYGTAAWFMPQAEVDDFTERVGHGQLLYLRISGSQETTSLSFDLGGFSTAYGQLSCKGTP